MTGHRWGGDNRGGAVEGLIPYILQHRIAPRDVALGGPVKLDPSIQAIPQRLDEIIDYAYPDALMVGATAHDEDTYTIYILDLDYSYTRWLASRSLADRWTLSPR